MFYDIYIPFISFRATIVKDVSKYWKGVKSDIVKYEEPMQGTK